jgi:hypothetical protein
MCGCKPSARRRCSRDHAPVGAWSLNFVVSTWHLCARRSSLVLHLIARGQDWRTTHWKRGQWQHGALWVMKRSRPLSWAQHLIRQLQRLFLQLSKRHNRIQILGLLNHDDNANIIAKAIENLVTKYNGSHDL